METDPALTTIYLYGFVPSDVKLPARAPDARTVFLVNGPDVSCAVGIVPTSEYERTDPAAAAADELAWIAPRAQHHHHVVRWLHELGAVVPFKFGTLCTDIDDVRAMLDRLRTPIVEMLARVRGKDEWTLKVWADQQALEALLQQTNRALIALREQERGLPEGRAYFVAKQLKHATMKAASMKLAAVEATIVNRIASLGIEIEPAKCLGKDQDQGRCRVTNLALLLERGRFDQLEEACAQLETELDDAHLTFELIGPWPPYSFVSTLLESPEVFQSN